MDRTKTLFILLLSVLIVIVSSKIGLFWDNVLFVSKMGTPLFNNEIFNWKSIPLEYDTGHPPFLATFMATGWKLFGRSLVVSHWLMLPFIFGLLWQIHSFVDFFIKEKLLQVLAFMLVVADPTLLSQLILVGPEAIQLFFFFLALNASLRGQRLLKIIGLALLGMVSYRGMMLCAGIFLIDLLSHLIINKKKFFSFFTKQRFVTYFLGALPAIIYLTWRLLVRGWISSHPLEIWENAWEFTSLQDFFKNFFRNILVLGLYVLDFGRAVPILFVLVSLFIKPKSIRAKKIQQLILIIFLSTSVIYITSLMIKNTMGHRYYIASFVSVILLAFVLIQSYKFKKVLYIVLLSSLLLGNLIVYSDSFAQGWDSSLAHIPYWKLRKNAIKYLDTNKLPLTQTASFFPNRYPIDDIDLNGDTRSFVKFTGNEKYVLYSNVYNLTDDELIQLQKNYIVIKTFKKWKVRVQILKKTRTHDCHNL